MSCPRRSFLGHCSFGNLNQLRAQVPQPPKRFNTTKSSIVADSRFNPLVTSGEIPHQLDEIIIQAHQTQHLRWGISGSDNIVPLEPALGKCKDKRGIMGDC